MALGMKVGLGPGHIVLDGDLAPPKGVQSPIFGACLLWPKGWMDQRVISYEGRLCSGHIVLHGDPSSQRGTAAYF